MILGYESRTPNQKAPTQPKAFSDIVERDGTPAKHIYTSKHYGAKCEFSHARQGAATTVRVVPGRTFSSSRVLSSFLENKGKHAKRRYTLWDNNIQPPHHVGNKERKMLCSFNCDSALKPAQANFSCFHPESK